MLDRCKTCPVIIQKINQRFFAGSINFSKEIGILKSNGEDSTEKTKAVEGINSKLESIKKLLLEAEEKFKNLLLDIPNILDDAVPIGSSEDHNKIEYYSDNINLLEKDNKRLAQELDKLKQEMSNKPTASNEAIGNAKL